MALDEITRLRDMIGEPIPDNGDEADTLFTNDKLQDWLLIESGNLNLAAFEGWKAKAGLLQGLVDSQTGVTKRSMSKLFDSAIVMVKLYEELMKTPADTEARHTVIRKISRIERGMTQV